MHHIYCKHLLAHTSTFFCKKVGESMLHKVCIPLYSFLYLLFNTRKTLKLDILHLLKNPQASTASSPPLPFHPPQNNQHVPPSLQLEKHKCSSSGTAAAGDAKLFATLACPPDMKEKFYSARGRTRWRRRAINPDPGAAPEDLYSGYAADS